MVERLVAQHAGQRLVGDGEGVHLAPVGRCNRCHRLDARAASGRSIAFSQGLDAHAVLARSVVEEAEADSGFGNGHFLPVVYLVEIGSGIRDGRPRDGHGAALLIHIGIQRIGGLQLRA